MFIKNFTLVRLHGGAIVLVTCFEDNVTTFNGYNISSTSMKVGTYETGKIQEKNVSLDIGKNIVKESRYDKSAEFRVYDVLEILGLDIVPKFRHTIKKARSRYHYPKKHRSNIIVRHKNHKPAKTFRGH